MINYLITFISSIILACGTLVILVQNPIHSILFLILVFANGSILLLFLQVEFFALIFLIVYVGAVIVLFLFIVMMLKIKHVNTSQNLLESVPFMSAFMILFIIELLSVTSFKELPVMDVCWQIAPITNDDSVHVLTKFQGNIQNLGKALYSIYQIPVLIIGILLFVAMIGAITISLNPNTKYIKDIIKTQDPLVQANRKFTNAWFFGVSSMKTERKVRYRRNECLRRLIDLRKRKNRELG